MKHLLKLVQHTMVDFKLHHDRTKRRYVGETYIGENITATACLIW